MVVINLNGFNYLNSKEKALKLRVIRNITKNEFKKTGKVPHFANGYLMQISKDEPRDSYGRFKR
tara:strand:+ start:267 stop:458 length:192 start_codon:yes stop_codon:yes gene_type:complete